MHTEWCDSNIKTLNLEEGSSLSTIKKAYRTLALKNHPDRKGSTSVMQRINSAYETLKKIGSTRKRTPTLWWCCSRGCSAFALKTHG